MTTAADTTAIAQSLGLRAVEGCLMVPAENLPEIAARLKSQAGGSFEYLDMITAVDYPQGFELIYRLLSLQHNQVVNVKTRVSKENPTVPSLVQIWKGADLQEREIYDLFGITFAGHPCLRRIMLWEGFQGHPLRKDYQRGS